MLTAAIIAIALFISKVARPTLQSAIQAFVLIQVLRLLKSEVNARIKELNR